MDIERIEVQLLHIINSDGDIKKLLHSGMSYRHIAELIETNIEKGNLSGENDFVSLTSKGQDFLQRNSFTLKEPDKSKWIGLDLKNKLQKFDKEDVFLPRKEDLSFLK